MLLLTFIAAALAQSPGDFRWLVSETELKRFSDSDEVSATVKAATRVEIIAVGESLLRVRAGRDMGWIAADALAETKPAAN
jgi:hypothetical protein